MRHDDDILVSFVSLRFTFSDVFSFTRSRIVDNGKCRISMDMCLSEDPNASRFRGALYDNTIIVHFCGLFNNKTIMLTECDFICVHPFANRRTGDAGRDKCARAIKLAENVYLFSASSLLY